jgi:hypothetical protein
LFCVIYTTPISIGLPGTDWPVMYCDLKLPLYFAVIFQLQLIVFSNNVAAALFSSALIKKDASENNNGKLELGTF